MSETLRERASRLIEALDAQSKADPHSLTPRAVFALSDLRALIEKEAKA